MAQFKIPESPTFNYLDLNNLQGMDSWDTNPNIMRSSDMLNIVKKEGLHQVRHNIRQSYLVGNYSEVLQEDDDVLYPVKYVGKIEDYDDNGNTVPYYIKISEYLGEYQVENDSRICISIWPTPNVKNVKYDMTQMAGFENYRISYQVIPFTNYGKSGNRQGLYEHIEFDGKERVFTPIGILSFNCSTTDTIEVINDETVPVKKLNFEIENVLDDPYIPTVIYGSTPDGLDFTKYESINLLSDKRKAQFLGDGTSTTYQLPEKDLDSSYCKVKILNANGTYDDLPSTDYTLSGTIGVVSFTTAPSVSPIDGKDNVIIEYKKKQRLSQANIMEFSCLVGNNMFEMDVAMQKDGVDPHDSTKTKMNFTITYKPGSNFDTSRYTLTSGRVNFVIPGGTWNFNIMSATKTALNAGNTAIENRNISVRTSALTDDFVWQGKFTATYTDNTGTTTVTTPGSVAQAISIGETNMQSSSFGWIGFRISATATGTVGSDTNGSDSYWTVTERVQLWVSRAEYLNCNAGTLYAIIDGSEINAGSTGNMYATSTIYPSTPLSASKRIAYSANKTSSTLSAKINFNPFVDLSGTRYYSLSCGSTSISLPAITLPHVSQTQTDITLTDVGTATYSESNNPVTPIIYDNIVPGSARLGCYYGAKCVTVYGYESDRRVFVSDGTNKDTYSGVTLDGTSSIYYFPDDNYNVLGEDTEILGYAQKHGYLLTFKRGEDSVYVRYGTTRNDDTIFPSTAVTRNIQVLSRPIQINDEVLVVTRSGIKSINFINNEVRAELRSYFINNYFELSADYNYDRMSWFIDDNLLHIFLDKYEFSADLVSKSYVREGANFGGTSSASTLDFQYEWYVSEYNWIDNRQVPQVVVYQPKDFERQNEGIVYESQRAIGYAPEGIYELFYSDYKVDVLMKANNNQLEYYYVPIKAHYITPFLNMGAINVAKTIKYVYVDTRSKNGDMFAIGYIDENGMTETMQKEYTQIKDYETKYRNSQIPFPKLIQIKSKIRKFMNVKLYLQNQAEFDNVDYITQENVADYGNMTFDRILIQYQVAGKYRGE